MDDLENKIIKRTVALIVFFDKNKKVLLQSRIGISKYGEEWSYFGGGVEKDETPKQAIIREIKEELSFDLTKINFKYIGKYDILFYNDKYFGNSFFFIAQLDEDILNKFNQKEGKSYKLFTIEEAKKLNPGCILQKTDFLILDLINAEINKF